MDSCERCKGPIERTDDDRFVCPRCGIWVHLDGAELGPPITEEQATANYEKFTVDLAKLVVAETSVQHDRVHAVPYEGIEMEHEDGWIYRYVVGEKPSRVRRSTSATENK